MKKKNKVVSLTPYGLVINGPFARKLRKRDSGYSVFTACLAGLWQKANSAGQHPKPVLEILSLAGLSQVSKSDIRFISTAILYAVPLITPRLFLRFGFADLALEQMVHECAHPCKRRDRCVTDRGAVTETHRLLGDAVGRWLSTGHGQEFVAAAHTELARLRQQRYSPSGK